MPVVWERVIESIPLLEPVFFDNVDTFLEDSPHTWYVLEAFRPLERSAELYAAYKAWKDRTGPRAPRAAPPGKSAHNFGLAVDVTPDINIFKKGLQPSWDIRRKEWRWLKYASIPHPRLTVGWRFGDWPHIQRFRWKRHRHWSDQGG